MSALVRSIYWGALLTLHIQDFVLDAIARRLDAMTWPRLTYALVWTADRIDRWREYLHRRNGGRSDEG